MTLDSSLLKGTSKSRQYKEYVRGPLPLKWFQRASIISRTAAVMGMIIWRIAYQSKLWGHDSQRRTSESMKVTNQTCMKWGVCGNSKNTALRLMEEAGLIRLELKRGRSPVVQIIDAELGDRLSKAVLRGGPGALLIRDNGSSEEIKNWIQ